MLLLPAAIAVLMAAPPDSKQLPPITSATTKTIADVTYATVGGEKLQLDLVLPTTPGPHPTIICFHGGGWVIGNRKDLTYPNIWHPGGRDGNKDLTILQKMAQRGYAAVTVSYRLAPTHKFPAQIEDAKTAVRFLRTNAKKYDLDPNRFAALGFSAGGHLALMLGLTDKDAGLDGTLYPDASSKVQCVIDFFGPTDMSLFTETAGVEKAFMVPFLGKECLTNPECYRRASPIEYVSKAAPPVLMIHGTLDLMVPIIHSERLLAKLKDAGAEAELYPVKWKGHGWEGDTAKETALKANEFLEKYLLKKEGKK